MNKLTGLKVVLILICVYHVGLGLAAFVSSDLTVRLAKGIFGLNLDMTPQLSYFAQLLGVYAMVVGVMTGLVASDPMRHRALLNVLVILYVLRIVNKVISMNQVEAAFGASRTKLWIDVVLLAVFGAAVFALKPRADTPASA